MKLYSWNVNGLRACMTKGFAEFLQEAAPDIICLQETKMQREQADFVFPGYEEYWNSAERKGYSGTAVFTRVKPLAVTYGLGQEEHDKEGRVITLEFESFYLVTVYTPNSKDGLARLDYRMVWEDVFRAYLQELDAKKPVVVCGDLNDSPISYSCHRLSSRLKSAFRQSGNGLGLSYNQKGFYFRIDHIFVSDYWQTYETHVDKTAPWSDHYPMITYLKKHKKED